MINALVVSLEEIIVVIELIKEVYLNNGSHSTSFRNSYCLVTLKK
ncbi:hypothetical protein ACQY1Q_11120 [Tenacibaculum sp. TC6]